MEIPRSPNRIHPVMAAAAVSVIIVSLVGAAAITGILPSSHSAPEPQLNQLPPQTPAYALAPANTAAPYGAPGQLAAQGLMPAAPVAYAQPMPTVAQQQPQVIKEVVIKEVVRPQPKPVHHHHTQQVVYRDAPSYQQAPQPAQPNYVAIGTGAVLGGLIGNQVGGGNGKKLATVAGVIGGGMLGNEIANRNR
jgi:uncharacterized protein YcfJ